MRRAWVWVTIAVVGCGDNINGNPPPELADAQLKTDEDTALTHPLQAVDPEDDAVTIELAAPAHGTATLADNRLTYTPAANYHGPDAVVVTVSDGKLSS